MNIKHINLNVGTHSSKDGEVIPSQDGSIEDPFKKALALTFPGGTHRVQDVEQLFVHGTNHRERGDTDPKV